MNVINRMSDARVVAILRIDNASQNGRLIDGLLDAGVKAFEFTMNRPGAVEAVRNLRLRLGDEVLIGGGTVTDRKDIGDLIDAGADFCVSPHLDSSLVKSSLDLGLPMMPGVLTPSEIVKAMDLGAAGVKLFPAGPVGPGYLRALRGPLGDVPVFASGGLDPSSVGLWLEAGAFCVGLGSALTEDPASLRRLAKDLLQE